MITIYCVSLKDYEIALDNVKWWNQLGGCPGHECLFLYDKRVPESTILQIQAELANCFPGKLFTKRTDGEVDGWPEGANYFFRLATAMIEQRPYKYFLWMEPDATPLKQGWMDVIEKEYLHYGKPFLGGRVQGVYNGQEVPLHMTGIAVYPSPLYNYAGEAYRAHDVAWDIAGKDQIIPLAQFTNLFCHSWNHPGFKSLAELETIPDSAVIHHGVKDGSLIHLLRQKRSGNTIQQKEPANLVAGSPASLSSVEAGDAVFHHTHPQRFGDVPPPGVHQVHSGLWVIENDMISGVINHKGRLDADDLIPSILPHITKGDTVIDAGAFVGDHTIAYAAAVGEEGFVAAFEPTPIAFQCLQHNMAGRSNVKLFQLAVGEECSPNGFYMVVEPVHFGGAYIGKSYDKAMFPVQMVTIDSTGLKPNVIKLDLEGYEFKALMGAEETIDKYKPKLIIEINQEALQRQGVEPKNIFWFLNDHGYDWTIVQQGCTEDSKLYDIVALPGAREREESAPASFSINDHIKALVEYASTGKEQRKYVLRLLRDNELSPKTVKKRVAKMAKATT